MKKLLIALMLVVFLLPVVSMAETVEFEDFSIDLPANYKTDYGDDQEYRVYENDESFFTVSISFSRIDTIYSLEEVAESYSSEVTDINGIPMVQWNDYGHVLNAVFFTGKSYYRASYEASFCEEENIEEWDAILHTLVITADTSIDEELAAAAEAYPTLEKGSKGDDVKALQQRLIDLLYLSGNADGEYGNKTKAAVEEFQKAAGILPVTGIADGITQAKLFADDAPEAELSISCSVAGINSYSTAYWNVNGQEFTLKNDQTKTLTTPWGTYKFDAYGNYEKIE